MIRLPGSHNLSNAAGAVCCASAMGCDSVSIRQALSSFKTLPHRLEPIIDVAGRSFYDDSIATTPESTLAALDSLVQPIWLIAGGYDKGSDFSAVARRIAERVEGVALLGQTADQLQALIGRLGRQERPVLVQKCADMNAAVRWCFDHSRRGDCIVLSPACASFGMFQNFVDRARAFRQAAEGLPMQQRKAG